MAKPIGNGKSKAMNGKSNSALDRSWLVTWEEETVFTNQGDILEVPEDGPQTDSNDFFYITSESEWDYSWEGANIDDIEDYVLPDIDGGGGADQLILMESPEEINDGFFFNIKNIKVLKLADDGNDVTLGFFAAALDDEDATGIYEVTGGAGDDIITFTDDYDGISVKVKGGCGQDVITLSEENGAVDEIILADVFSAEDGDTIINFEAGIEEVDINDIIMLSSGTDLGLIGTETSDGFEAEGSGYFYEFEAGNTMIYYFDSELSEGGDDTEVTLDEIQLIGTVEGAELTPLNFDFV